jgi:hypothetical protein
MAHGTGFISSMVLHQYVGPTPFAIELIYIFIQPRLLPGQSAQVSSLGPVQRLLSQHPTLCFDQWLSGLHVHQTGTRVHHRPISPFTNRVIGSAAYLDGILAIFPSSSSIPSLLSLCRRLSHLCMTPQNPFRMGCDAMP